MLDRLSRRWPHRTRTEKTPDLGGAIRVSAPVDGALVPLVDVSDAAFASGALGMGVGIAPTDGHIVSPVTGRILTLMPHAIGLRTDEDAQILVHVGIDTVTLKGHGFTTRAVKGTQVHAGDPLVDVDLAVVTGAGLDPTVLVTLMNAASFTGISTRGEGLVEHGDLVIVASLEEHSGQ